MSNEVICPIPDLPAATLLHASSTLLPTGETTPMPVITTRLWSRLRLRVVVTIWGIPPEVSADKGFASALPARWVGVGLAGRASLFAVRAATSGAPATTLSRAGRRRYATSPVGAVP